MEVSSAYFIIGMFLNMEVQLFVYIEKRMGTANAVLYGAPVFELNTESFDIRKTNCGLCVVRQPKIQS